MGTKRTAVVKTVQPVQTGSESGYIVYNGSLLLGFIRDDVMRGPLASILGPHVLLHPLKITTTQFRQCCLMPGLGYVDR